MSRAPRDDFWVFGYGSLIWRPGFAFKARANALLHGAHRRLCVLSHVHRGTVARPGLVMGLDRGGSCRGIAYRVEGDQYDETIAYLRAREQVTMVYLERVRPVHLLDPPHEVVSAVCYMVDHAHHQYAGEMTIDEQARIVAHGQGRSGPNDEYLHSMVVHLRELGIHDPALEAVDAAVGAMTPKGAQPR